MSDIFAWECGSCEKTNEDMARCHCLICGEQRPVCYYIAGGPIESEIGRWWYGRSAELIDANVESGAHDNFPHSAYGQKQKKEGRHQKIETLTGEIVTHANSMTTWGGTKNIEITIVTCS